jgi:nucleotide-binding universal stress UspA family protein
MYRRILFAVDDDEALPAALASVAGLARRVRAGAGRRRGEAMTRDTPVHRIVVGLDGSDGSRDALRWTIALATATGAYVVAVHAFEPARAAPLATGLGLLPSAGIWAESEQRTFEDDWCAPLREAGIAYRTVCRAGPADLVLVEVANETAADLLVTGCRGRGALVGLLAGSVSQRLVHRASCPVVIVPRTRVRTEQRRAAVARA